ncbi:MAG: DUF6293 family protein [Candidatus Methanofastidiosia archaeon]
MGILQIASVSDDISPIMTGVREYPVSKLVLITDEEHLERARDVEEKLKVLRIKVEIRTLGEELVKDMLETIADIFMSNLEYDDVYINVAGETRQMGCAALSGVFVNGIKPLMLWMTLQFLLQS